ncbi:sensor histidine kinase [Sphingobium sp. B11D3A]|uniref:sensor histidine kinase n=1 Tax=Sphingobium sp. B11D3A TaxID=2940574 RepID=UPI00222531B5|nr:sensor histidine kinase [Sphingobium sp. B11D3A]MCW2393536.1 signal transduction histidine kinase [Sphingobium sp. B11D3A]
MDQLLDPSRKVTLPQILSGQAGRFSASDGDGINLGYRRMAVWTKLSIENPHDRQDLILSINPSFTDVVDIYYADKKTSLNYNSFLSFRVGDHRPIPKDRLSNLSYGIPISINKGQSIVVFIRAESIDSSLNLSVTLYPKRDHVYNTAKSAILVGAWFGGMFILLAIQLVFFFFRRQTSYILISLSTLGLILVYTGNMGVSHLIIFPRGGTGNDVFMGMSLWFGMMVSSLSARRILRMPESYPVCSKFFEAGVLFAVIGMLFALSHRTIDFSGPGQLVILAFAWLATAISVHSAYRGGSQERLNAAAYIILHLGLLATIAQRVAILSLPNWAAHGYAISSLVFTLLLTTGLVVQLRAAEVANREMERQALADAKASEQRAMALVEDRTRQLAEAKAIAEDALRAELHSQEQQVKFMEVISHQYRTPLATIRSNVDGLELGLPPGDSLDRQRIIRIRRGISRLVETLEINLARSRLQGNAFQPRLHPAMLGGLVARAGNHARDLAQGARIEIDIAPQAWAVKALIDADMISIAILNLLENAVKYSCQPQRGPITLRCQEEASHIIISVTDCGIGIPAPALPDILARSTRAANAAHIEGSGIGLSLVSRIVDKFNGTLKIDSVEGIGTTVTISLPTVDEQI